MPRYFVDTSDDDLFVEDEEGQELAGVNDARRLALSVLPDMAREKMPNGDRRSFLAIVRDEGGRVVYRATLTLRGEWTR
ncbi:DUF6894 family protein [Methylobacterium organophilum]|uniref:DUF6894 domain-containing protein n=1 Tax=Methylobacterium organophilum TaxID=410 RepID=A0ABQ4TG52_METOR|nr:hypothetical protein [Methylobacterium organophilum]GJE29110.1 hypothetical protein LKMONMHP_3986 [Methylobacterium organophilum]